MLVGSFPCKHAVYTLGRLYAELLGRRRRRVTDTPELRVNIEHVAATILLLDPGCDLAGIKPIRRNRKNAIFKHGSIFRAVLSVLRMADESLIASEIGRRLFEARGINPTGAQRRSMTCAVRTSLRNNEGKTVAVVAGSSPVLWVLLR